MRRLRSLSLPALLLALTPAIATAAPWTPSNFIDPDPQWSRDVELADLDGDGYVDILFANVGGVFEGTDDAVLPNQAFKNDNGTGFIDISIAVFGQDPDVPDPPTTVKDTAHVIKACDLDNDGDQDLVLGATWGNQSQLLLNDGGGTFTNVTDTHFPAKMASVGDVECGDVDGDGDRDLVLTDWGPAPVGQNNSLGATTMLWINQGADGDWAFEDMTNIQMPDIAVNYSLDVDFVDVDNDYDLDIALACKGCATGSLLYVNDGAGVFTQQTPAAFAEPGNVGFESMDINSDGYMDLLSLGDGDGGLDGFRNRILINNGIGDFEDQTVTYWPLIENPGSGDRAAVFLDHDSDADVDIALGTNASLIWPDRLMVNDGGTYTQNTAPYGGIPGTEGTLALETVDLNGDHHPDIVLAAGENAFENAIFLGDSDDTATDTTPPALMHVEQVDEAPYPGDVVIHARVHDYKTPNKPHDWEAVYIEWAEGNVDADYLESNGIQVDAYFYGENMFIASYPVPDSSESTYRLCAIDIAGNIACSDVTVTMHPGGTESDTDTDSSTDSNTDSNGSDSMGSDSNSTASATNTDSNSSDSAATDSDSNTESGASDSNSASASASATASASDSASATETETDSGGGLDDDGCDCSTQRGPDGGWTALALLALLGFRRRRAA
ncbi:MAG: VCBS repeat-containing protein [Myxococcales bacterium]|nr:VCBS repeat-containing protein [Myxococcales bacterium]